MSSVKKPALQYFGGKWQLAPWIISHFPQHTTYVEPYAGGASVLLRKAPSPIEVYNDLDGNVVNFFQVLRDHGSELIRRIELTPYSHAEFMQAYDASDDAIENARRFIVRCMQGFNTAANRNTGWTYSTNDPATYKPVRWNNLPERLAPIIDRLKLVQIDNRPALETIERYDTPNTLFYVDPPYLLETRKGSASGYKVEMHGEQQHTELAQALSTIRGMAIVSGYDCPLYDALYSGWRKVSRLHDTRYLVNGATQKSDRVEVLWLSPNIQANQHTLPGFE